MMSDAVAPEVRLAVQNAITQLKAAGHQIVEIDIPTIDVSLAVYYVVVPAELSSNLSRHDGQRYQFSAANPKNLDDAYTRSRSEGFGREAKRRIMLGTYVLSSGFYDAYYKKAQKARTKVIEQFDTALSQCDFLIGPTAPTPAFMIGEHSKNPLEMYAQDIMTVGVSLAGLPAISLPLKVENGQLPIGLQVIGGRGNDAAVLEFAGMFMRDQGVWA